MKVEWSVVSRLKKYIGEINFEKDLGVKFISLLDENKFDEASDMVKKSGTVSVPNIETLIIKHIESYKYGC